MDFYAQLAPKLLAGAGYTLVITAGAMTLGLVLGLVVALGRRSRIRAVERLAYWYVEVVRGTPLLVQLFLIYYGLPQYGIRFDPLPAAILGIGINYSAYLSEVYRAGIAAIPHGQWEAGHSIGLSDRRVMWTIVLPQSVRIVLPPIGNYLISCLKDSALAATITVNELLRRGQLESALTFRSFEIFIAVALVYFVISYPCSRLVQRLERRYGSYV